MRVLSNRKRAARTFPLWPVKVCWNQSTGYTTLPHTKPIGAPRCQWDPHSQPEVVHGPDATSKVIGGRQQVGALRQREMHWSPSSQAYPYHRRNMEEGWRTYSTVELYTGDASVAPSKSSFRFTASYTQTMLWRGKRKCFEFPPGINKVIIYPSIF